MEIKFYNSLTNKLEHFIPLCGKNVDIYVCGPTVYGYVHIGNMRPVVVFDVMRRFLTYLGYDVTYVSNFTDVDDKIIATALKEGKTEKEIADKYIKAFENDVQNIFSLPPSVTPRVTEYMDKIIAFISDLIAKDAAYVVDGDVYFKVTKIKDYGALSNMKIDDLLVGARIEENSKKQSPLDFTLWKKTEVGIKWKSPWSEGRPGWHTECVVMINSIFPAGKIDFHCGGFDLKFPHHENEIAQSEAYRQNKIANYWLHNGFINLNNEKMSKSLGNIVTAKDAIAQFGGNVVRLLLISTHYRAPLNFAPELLVNTENELQKITFAYRQLAVRLQLENADLKGTPIHINPFLEALADDLNTANSMSEIFRLVKDINQLLRSSTFDIKSGQNYLQTLADCLLISGLNIDYPVLGEEDRKLYQDYLLAKAEKRYNDSDELRKQLIMKKIL